MTASTAAADPTPLPSLKEALSKLATPDPVANGAGNGAAHAKGSNGAAPPADDPPTAPAIKKSRPEPAPERLDPSQQELDDFSPAKLKSAQEHGDEDMGLTNSLVSIRVDRPGKKEFIRCYDDPKTYINMRLIKNDIEGIGDKKFYFVPERMATHQALVDHWKWYTVFPIITRQGRFSLWPVGCREEDGNMAEAHLSARRVLAIARYKWVRCWWAGNANQCKELEAEKALNIPTPPWPYPAREPLDVLRSAFSGYTVDDDEHMLCRLLDGRA